MNGKLKGASLYQFAIGIVLVAVGVTFLYILPPYIITTLNSTNVFSTAAVSTANTQVAQVQAVGFAVIILGLIFLLVGVIGSVGGGKGGV
jgi:hypothetical protein